MRRLPWIRIDLGELRGQWPWKRAFCPACEALKGRRPSTRDLAVTERGYAKCFAMCELRDGALVKGLAGPGGGEAWTSGQRSAQPASRSDAQYIDSVISSCRGIEDSGPVARYLTARGFGPPWPTLRQISEHPALDHRPTETTWPTMVAQVWRLGVRVGIHRTYLTPDGQKAPVDPNRMSKGSISGGHIEVNVPSDWGGTTVAVAEGIESAMGLRFEVPKRFAVWSCLSAGGLVNVVLPREVREVIIGPDNDRSGVGLKAAARLHRALTELGIVAYYRIPPLGKDFADLALERSRRVL